MAKDKVSASIFLIKSSHVATFRREIADSSDELLLNDNIVGGSFIPVSSQPRMPSWASAVAALLQQPVNLNLTNQSAGGLLVIERAGVTFVVSFGHAWLRLKDVWLERDFGRSVALNAIPKDGLLEIGAEQVFAKWHLARERAPRASSLEEFGVEYDRDLVSAIEGVPTDGVFGSVIRGGASLRVNINIDDLPEVLDKALVLYRSKKYQKHWPEIDNLVPVDDTSLIDQLVSLLDQDLAAGEGPKKVVLFSPMLRRDDAQLAESYVFGRLAKSPATVPYLTFTSWESHLKRDGVKPSVEAAKRMPVHLLDGSKDEIAKCNVYECIGYETSLKRRQYVLSSGVWYEAIQDFVEAIQQRVGSLQKPPITLPRWDGIVTEGEYNKHCYNKLKPELLHFDAKNVGYGGGRSKFEFCDLMHPAKRTLFFAKIPTRSADMSHLSEQTRRTVELLFNPDQGFRNNLKDAMKKHYPRTKRDWLDARPRPGDWNLCLVSLGKEANALPFFAKCGLARLVKELEGRGHIVSYLAV